MSELSEEEFYFVSDEETSGTPKTELSQSKSPQKEKSIPPSTFQTPTEKVSEPKQGKSDLESSIIEIEPPSPIKKKEPDTATKPAEPKKEETPKMGKKEKGSSEGGKKETSEMESSKIEEKLKESQTSSKQPLLPPPSSSSPPVPQEKGGIKERKPQIQPQSQPSVSSSSKQTSFSQDMDINASALPFSPAFLSIFVCILFVLILLFWYLLLPPS